MFYRKVTEGKSAREYVATTLKKCLLELEQYIFIHCYLDNDLAGQKTVETIAGLYGIKVIDHSKNYYNYKDLNDYLRGKRR